MSQKNDNEDNLRQSGRDNPSASEVSSKDMSMKTHKAGVAKQIYEPSAIEPKWQVAWKDNKLFSPDIEKASNPYFNLMMFPYPSAEGLHVGNMYAFTGADIYARFNRMNGKGVFEPIGLDGFGIHSENYAIKVGRHPKDQAQIAEKNFYRQLSSIGNSFDWQRTIETYNPDYYKWTQWLFIQLFKFGHAYRKKAEVNWCPKDLTVLSDEQVEGGKCERCGSEIEKKELEQWFFRITEFASRLLNNIDSLKWSEKVKIAQRNWIGKSEGAEVDFEVDDSSNYVLLHGYTGSVEANFFPWIKRELEKKGKKVWAQNLPNTDKPNIDEQVDFVIKNAQINEQTEILGHSLGSVVALKILERLERPIKKLVLAAGFMQPGFLDHERIFEKSEFNWKFDSEKIKKNVGEIIYLRASNDSAVPKERADYMASQFGGRIIDFAAQVDHICGEVEPVVLENLLTKLKVFTTRPDTLYGATFMVIAPEHDLSAQICQGKILSAKINEVRDYVEKTKAKSVIERTAEGKEKTGVVTGLFAINPVSMKKIPILVSDYVLSGYGTGAIMAVPAHDQRDFETAKKFGFEIVPVIQENDGNSNADFWEEAYLGEGKIIGSDEWNGFSVPQDVPKVIDWLEVKGIGKRKVNYHLRDWLISRQRYWGPPIPMVYCSKCSEEGKNWFDAVTASKAKQSQGIASSSSISRNDKEWDSSGWFPVPEAQLPVELPDVEDWKPMGTGKAPLANHPEFYKTKCPNCGGEAVRETDVSDTFLDSSWYFLRYPSTDIKDKAFELERTKKWLPVNQYIGGAEHAVLHLLYSRFITMSLHDMGLLDFEEPFANFFAHGLIIKDGAKMSKSKGNVVVPDKYIKKYGADSLRTYLMFLGPYSDGGDFSDSGIEGMYRFIRRVWKLMSGAIENESLNPNEVSGSKYYVSSELEKIMNITIKAVTEDIANFSYNTAIARIMEYYNALNKYNTKYLILNTKYCKVLILLLAPFAPHMTEELWQRLSKIYADKKDDLEGSVKISSSNLWKSIHLEPWPQFDASQVQDDILTVIIQINGKKRGELKIDSKDQNNQEKIEDLALSASQKYLEDQKIRRTVYITGKIINFVI